jgi:nicotinate-nucleotide adenylyltransferase
MTVIATASNPRFKVSRIDIDREGPTYTVDTLFDMQKLYPDADLVFISGADAIAQITTWKDSDQLWPLAHFVAVSRPGHQMTIPVAPEGAISILEIPALAISSTDIRARAQTGKPVWYLVSDGVVQYIAKNKLYGQND